MRDLKKILVGLNVLTVLGCSHGTTKGLSGREVQISGPVKLEINNEAGHTEVTHYRYDSIKDTHDERKIRVKREEVVDFKTKSVVTSSKGTGEVDVRMETFEKDGEMDLNDLSFPEKGEAIDFVMDRASNVIKAGNYPPESIFFVQPVPLPPQAVSKGDTWEIEQGWLSRNNGMPLKLDIIGILTKFVECGENDRCADIEISGKVTVPTGLVKATLESKVEGHLLFALRGGLVVWSEIRTHEKLITADEKVLIGSCMESILDQPRAYESGKQKPFCTPK